MGKGLSRRRVLGTAALGGAALVSGFPTVLRAQPKAVKIGLIHPVTGGLAFSGSQCRLGCQMAIEDVNAAGGIKSLGGAKIEALLGDAQSKPEVGVAEVEKMNEAGADALVGCFSSAIGLAATQAAAKYNIPFAIDVGVSDRLTQRGLKNVFRISDGFGKITEQGLTNLDQLNKSAGSPAKSVVIVHEDSEFGTGTAKLIAEGLPRIGLELKDTIKNATPTRDFSNVALRIRSLKPDIVMASNYQNEYVLLARTLRQQKVQLVAQYSILGGGYGLKFVKELPEVAEYMIDSNHWSNPKAPRGPALRKRVEAMPGGIFSFENLLSYNTIKLLADAYERAGSTDKEKVIAALESSTFSGEGLPYRKTQFVNGQNMGAQCLAMQVLKGDIQVIWPPEYSSAAPVFPKPKG